MSDTPTTPTEIPSVQTPQSDITVLHRSWTFSFTFPQDYELGAYRGKKTWTLNRLSQVSKANYTRHLEKVIRQGIERHSYGPDCMSEYSYKIAMGEWIRGFASGSYKIGKPLFQETLEDIDNLVEFLVIWFGQVDPMINSQIIIYMYLKSKKQLVELVNGLLNDPNLLDPLE